LCTSKDLFFSMDYFAFRIKEILAT